MTKIVSKIKLVNKDDIEINPASNDSILSALNGALTTVRLDEVSDTLFYVGKAPRGSSETSSVWDVIKYTTIGSVLKSEFAPANSKWSDRATLTYL